MNVIDDEDMAARMSGYKDVRGYTDYPEVPGQSLDPILEAQAKAAK